jgi:NADH:ubiquinone oxidoreductase subunit 5 (subunit L)/multisubunit Na+/H+ antiporter MnhA subunit
MLLRLITVISLILFLLLMISGAQIDVALYRSILVFMILFSIVYLSIFLLNVVRQNNHSEHVTVGGNSQETDQEK